MTVHAPTGPCSAQSPVQMIDRGKTGRKARCNRPEGHQGPHREYRRPDALVLAEWKEHEDG